MEAGSAKRWPPESVLELVGLTRDEWDDMEAAIGRENLPFGLVVEAALGKALRRRRDELAREQR